MEQISAGITAVLKLLKREWFAGRFSREEAVYLVPLLLKCWHAADAGTPIFKKDAREAMGAEDVKTARKYVALAVKEGLLRSEPSRHDRRRELLLPTEALAALMREEFESLVESLDRMFLDPQSAAVSEAKHHYAASQIVVPHALTQLLEGQQIPLLADLELGVGQRLRLTGVRLPNRSTAGYEDSLVQRLLFPSSSRIKIIPGARHLHYSGKVHPDDLAAAEALAALCEHMVDVAPSVAPDATHLEKFEGTLLLIGGETSNSVTALLLAVTNKVDPKAQVSAPPHPIVSRRFKPLSNWLPPLVKITDQDWEPLWGIEDSRTGEVMRPQVDAQNRLLTDFLILTVVPNYLSAAAQATGDKIVIIEGVHGVGTKAVALLFENKILLEELRSQSETAEAWQAIVTVTDISYAGERPEPRVLGSKIVFAALDLPF